MSEVMIAVMLLVPIIIVIIILNTVHKSGKRKQQAKIHQYITDVMRQTAAVSHHRQQLIHQTVIIDEKSRRLLLIAHKKDPFSYEVFHLDLIENVQVLRQQHPTMPSAEKLVTHIGVQLQPVNKFITLYDYHEHNVFQMADFEKEAVALKQTIDKTRIHSPNN